jgi:hypothetical protein
MAALLCIALLAVNTVQTLRWYEVDYYESNGAYSSFNPLATALGTYAASLTGPDPTIIVYAPALFPSEPIAYLQGRTKLIMAYWGDTASAQPKPLDQLPPHPTAIVVTGDPSAAPRFLSDWLRRYPGLQVETHVGRRGEVLFVSVALPPG